MAGSFLGMQIRDLGALSRSTGLVARDCANAVSPARRVKTRTNNNMKNEFIPAINVIQLLKVVNIYVNLFAGLDIGYSLAEDVRPLFGQQRGYIVLLFGLVIKPLGLFTFTNDAADSALTHGHD